jgi:SpoVK/Ycf46/Vps4 family AAA+-type ATPase
LKYDFLQFDLSDYDQRLAILKKYLAPFSPGKSVFPNNKKSSEINFEGLALKTEGFSGSDLDRACSLAIQKLFRRRVKIKEKRHNDMASEKRHSVSQSVESSRNFSDDLEESIGKVRPLNESWKKRYDKWKCGNGQQSQMLKN